MDTINTVYIIHSASQPCVHPSICLIHPPIHASTIHPFIHPSIHLSIHPPLPSFCTYWMLTVCCILSQNKKIVSCSALLQARKAGLLIVFPPDSSLLHSVNGLSYSSSLHTSGPHPLETPSFSLLRETHLKKVSLQQACWRHHVSLAEGGECNGTQLSKDEWSMRG